MSFEKVQINRAIEELNECLINILNSGRDQYALRIRQLLKKINDNEILNYIIKPYFDLKLDEENIGFIKTGHHMKSDFIIPENEDEEIALILNVLKNMSENENAIENDTYSIYMQSSYDENFFLFNKRIVEPAFKKLIRKLQYKLEDISVINSGKIEAGDITIINVGQIDATNSMVALGKQITQQYKNIFEETRQTINTKIKNENDRNELIQALNEMEKNISDKNTFKQCYDAFILKIGSYMSILAPFLPYLATYLSN